MTRRPAPFRMRSAHGGFTLLEVLVALLVFSVGVIGIAGLQLLGVSNSRDAYFRTQAVMLSYDIADRMRANQDGVGDGEYDDVTGALNNACRTTAGCTPAQMAADDVALWRQSIADFLPGGEGTVCIDSTPNDGTGQASPSCDGTGNQYVVKIWWVDNRDPTGNRTRLATVFVPWID